MNAVAKVEPTDLATVPAQGTQLIDAIARAAADPTVDVGKMERLMQMHQQLVAQHAEREFNAAMSRVQGGLRRIAADSNNPQTKSRYASYAALDRALRPLYSKEGLSLTFNTAEAPADVVRLTCDVLHTNGHAKHYRLDMPADGKGAKGGDVMTKTHAAGSAMSYGMRYLLKLIFNVAIGEDDDDGNGASRRADHDALLEKYADWAEVIKGCTTLDELGAQWAKMPAEARKVLATLKDARKRTLAEG